LSFPSHPFWDYSVSLYGKPGVADACLYLQDRYGLNVNCILLCVWIAAEGRGALTGVHVATALRRIADWEAQAIGPLREIRRKCRREPLGVPEFLLQPFAPHIEAAELAAEHVEQLVLADTVRDLAVADTCGEPVADAELSLQALLDAAGVTVDARLNECFDDVLRAAFPDAAGSGVRPT